MTYLWPGLAQVWERGAWSGLAMAVGFGVLLNLTLVASFVWVELASWEMCGAAWVAVVVVWVGWAVLGLGWDRHEANERLAAAADDLFGQAQAHYLQRNWFEAEKVLSKLLHSDAGDVEARLMLATMWRRTGRLQEALQQLDRLDRMEKSERWQWEIVRERAAVGALTEKDTMKQEGPPEGGNASRPGAAESRCAA